MSLSLTELEKKIYGKQMLLGTQGIKGQEILKNTRVLIIGVGGLGLPTLQTLCNMGVGTITLIDPDVIELSNIDRQFLYCYTDVGKKKVAVAQAYLAKHFPFIIFNIFPTYFNEANAENLIAQHDVVVESSDNFATKYLCNDVCVVLKKPFVLGSVDQVAGLLGTFNYLGGATYRCLFPTPPMDAATCTTQGVLPTLTQLIGSWMGNEVRKIILQESHALTGQVAHINLYQNTVQFIKVPLQSENLQVQLPMSGVEAIYLTRQAYEEMPHDRKKDWLVVDIRSTEEFGIENIGGTNVPIHQLQSFQPEIEKVKDCMIVCKHGINANLAYHLLRSKCPNTRFYILKSPGSNFNY
ncbi:MAG: ThiF family adenylyltransferase [Phycisphaerales bacterium]|nr:ThiF family adenylyltransferase [Phycisphaerales bacterium]